MKLAGWFKEPKFSLLIQNTCKLPLSFSALNVSNNSPQDPRCWWKIYLQAKLPSQNNQKEVNKLVIVCKNKLITDTCTFHAICKNSLRLKLTPAHIHLSPPPFTPQLKTNHYPLSSCWGLYSPSGINWHASFVKYTLTTLQIFWVAL